MKDIANATKLRLAALTVVILLSSITTVVRSEKPTLKDAEMQATDPKRKSLNQSVAPQDTKPVADFRLPVYKPPLRGAPLGRVAGGTRGMKAHPPLLEALAPEHIGLTVQEQPTLYWYLAEAVANRIELTLIDDKTVQPLLERTFDSPTVPGVQRVRLADYGVRLQTGVPYQWFVTLGTDPTRRSEYIVAGAAIERIELTATLQAQLAQSNAIEAVSVYAAAGLWYDALRVLSDLIEAAPGDPILRQQRAALLEQVGLTDIAKEDMQPRGAAKP
jgi:hypothetical protein